MSADPSRDLTRSVRAGAQYEQGARAPQTPERWRQISELLDATLELPQSQRASYVRDACAPDPELRRAVERVLEGCERGEPDDDFLAEPAALALAPVVAELDARAQAAEALIFSAVADALRDRYALERELGRGGAAIVYLAKDLRHPRRVAIKVLKPELAASLHADRFLFEMDLTASFVHTNILTLLESGRAGDRLYYVTPYVEEESLAKRLARVGSLPVADAVRIAQQVASALDYAHRHGIVHRDVKPGNILLPDGNAQVADFGIARAMTLAGDERLSKSGTFVGTLEYMSPEQATSGATIDGRADIYSLGCVLYEMLAGELPYRGDSGLALIAMHAAAPIPDVRLARPEVPIWLARVVAKAMAKAPDDRFATAAELGEALGGLAPEEEPTPREPLPTRLRLIGEWSHRHRRMVLVGAAGIALAAATWPFLSTPALDPARYAIAPLAWSGGPVPPALDPGAPFDAFARWTGIDVVNLARDGSGRRSMPRDGTSARRAARAARAGRYVVTAASSSGDSIRIEGALHDTETDSVVTRWTVRAGVTFPSIEAAVAALARHLLFGDLLPHANIEAPGTAAAPAYRAFLSASQALERWDLAAADSGFDAATQQDPRFAQAWLRLALVRAWRGERPSSWTFAADHAGKGRPRLAGGDREALDALLALASGDHVRACALWSRLATADSADFKSWYALGHCLRRDDAVLPDASSPSGWRFRTSYHAALAAYERAFRLQPSLHRSFRGASFEDIRRLLITESDALRRGRALSPDTIRFLAYPSWSGDTLAFIPYAEREFGASRSVIRTNASRVAVRRQRERFHRLTLMWRAAHPESVDALEAVAVALDLLENTSALDTLRAARRLATDADDRLRIGALEIWMRVKLSAPHDVAGLRLARALADSLLTAHRPADREDARRLAGLAALTGRGALAARLARQAEARSASPSLADVGPALVAFAALGGPADSLDRLAARVAGTIRGLTGQERDMERAAWLVRPAFLALPDYRFASADAADTSGSTQARLLAAWQTADLPLAHRVTANLRARRERAALRAFELTPDGVYPEAAVLASLGDRRGALEWLRPPLDSLSLAETETLADVARAGALVRAMRLRAELERAVGDPRAARAWATSVHLLWSGADDFLQPSVRRMQALAR